ncbi:hypothetical protein ABJ384_04325 [Acinetobacter sp. A1-4-2]|uniref:Uncharacterized protein n=1 Tax=Acinetobacter sp. A1-4-2 TaxID=3156489 RepID=A0AAU7SYW0_9GAMM
MKRFKTYFLLYASLLIWMSTNLTHAVQAMGKPQPAKVYDLFSGTVHEEHGQLVLTHCTLSKYAYPLHFNHPEDEKQIKSLLRKAPNFWLNLRAQAYTENERFHLILDEIAEIHLQASWHLSDLLPSQAKL